MTILFHYTIFHLSTWVSIMLGIHHVLLWVFSNLSKNFKDAISLGIFEGFACKTKQIAKFIPPTLVDRDT